jgi:hypothetical protein
MKRVVSLLFCFPLVSCLSSSKLAICFMPVSCIAYSSSLKMEVARSSETLVDFQQAIQHFIVDDRNLHNHAVRTSNPTLVEIATRARIRENIAWTQNVCAVTDMRSSVRTCDDVRDSVSELQFELLVLLIWSHRTRALCPVCHTALVPLQVTAGWRTWGGLWASTFWTAIWTLRVAGTQECGRNRRAKGRQIINQLFWIKSGKTCCTRAYTCLYSGLLVRLL